MSLSLEVTGFTAALAVAVGYLVTFTVDRVGRKTWTLIAYAAAVIGLLYGVIETMVFHDYHWPVLLTTASIGFGSLGGIVGLLLYAYTAELYPTRMRAWATSIGTSLNRLASIISTYAVGLLLAAFSAKYLEMGYIFLMFLLISLVGLFVLAVFGIETKKEVLEKLSP